MLDQNKKKVLISFDLSKNEFKEIPQPDDPRYDSKSFQDLGIINGCLCIFKLINLSNVDLNWVMKNYNVKQSWELLQYERSADNDNQNDVIHYLKPADSYYIPHTSFFTTPITYLSCQYLKIWNRAAIPVFVQSLVSPHMATRRRLPSKRKREPNNNDKLIKGDTSAT